MRYYHLFKQSRQYTGHPYCGPTSIYMESEFSSLEDAKKAQQEFTERNPVGLNIYDSETLCTCCDECMSQCAGDV